MPWAGSEKGFLPCYISLNVCPNRLNSIELPLECNVFNLFYFSSAEPNLILQGEQVFFIVTNYIETPNQRLNFCAEVSYYADKYIFF